MTVEYLQGLKAQERSMAGDDAAAEEGLFGRFRERVFVMALARTGDHAAACDIAQDAIVATLTGMREGRIRDSENLPGYLYGAARHLIAEHFRQSQREPLANPGSLARLSSRDGQGIEEKERFAIARQAIDLLRPSDRELLLLTLVDGLTPAEIADRLELSSQTIRKRKSRALLRARKALKRVTNRASKRLLK